MTHKDGFPYRSLFEFLHEKGVTSGTSPEEVKRLKAEYWKGYREEYRKNYRKRHREVSFALPQRDFEELERRSLKMGTSVPHYVRSLIGSRLKSEPEGDLETERILRAITKLQLNIHHGMIENHITHKAPTYDLFLEVIERIEGLEEMVKSTR